MCSKFVLPGFKNGFFAATVFPPRARWGSGGKCRKFPYNCPAMDIPDGVSPVVKRVDGSWDSEGKPVGMAQAELRQKHELFPQGEAASRGALGLSSRREEVAQGQQQQTKHSARFAAQEKRVSGGAPGGKVAKILVENSLSSGTWDAVRPWTAADSPMEIGSAR